MAVLMFTGCPNPNNADPGDGADSGAAGIVDNDVTGTVDFLVTDTSSNEWRVDNVPVIDGGVSSSLSGLPVGRYTITATYSGDAKYRSVTQIGVNGVDVIPASP